MLKTISELFREQTPVAKVIISISLMLFSGFLMTRVTKKLRLPNVTAYILSGIFLGPYCLDLIPGSIIEGTDFIADIALAFIAFSTGEFFRFSALKRNGARLVPITILEALCASLLVFILCHYVLELELTFSAVLAALASATAPASTMMTIRQTGAKGDFVDTLLQVVALDDVVALIAFSVAISVSLASKSGSFRWMDTVKPVLINLFVLALGGGFGVLLKWLMPLKRSSDNRLIISIALLFSFCGVCTLLNVSPLLGCMSMGMVYINLTDNDKLFKQLNYFSPPILLIFFVRSGLNFRLDALFGASDVIGTTPLLVIGVLYFLVRIIGKYAGAFVGCALVHKQRKVRNYLGLALIPQAGVAIGLAAMGARILGDASGSALETIILASSVLYELVGPVCAKLSLYLSGSYSNKLEEITQQLVIEPEEKLSDAELLIRRIQAIQEDLPEHKSIVLENEQAFLEAAEEQYAMHGRAHMMTRRR